MKETGIQRQQAAGPYSYQTSQSLEVSEGMEEDGQMGVGCSELANPHRKSLKLSQLFLPLGINYQLRVKIVTREEVPCGNELYMMSLSAPGSLNPAPCHK